MIKIRMGELKVHVPTTPYSCFGIAIEYILIDEKEFEKKSSISAYRYNQGFDPILKEHYIGILDSLIRQLKGLEYDT